MQGLAGILFDVRAGDAYLPFAAVFQCDGQ